MKKILMVFHDATLIDLALLFKIFKRYFYIPLALFVFANPAGLIMYGTQRTIYSMDVLLAINTSPSNDTLNEIGGLLGARKRELNDVDIISIASSWKFKSTLAAKIIAHKNFDDFVFGPVAENRIQTAKEKFAICNENKECIQRALAKIIGGLYRFETMKDAIKVKLLVSTLSKQTTEVIIRSIQETLLESRVNFFKQDFHTKIALLEKLIDKEFDELKKNGYSILQEDNQLLDPLIQNLERSIVSTNTLLEQHKIALLTAESQLKHIKKIKGVGYSSQKKKDFEMANKLKEKIVDLNNNIIIFSSPLRKKSSMDEQLLEGLRRELAATELELKKLGDVVDEDVAFEEQFANSQERQGKHVGIEYKVLLDKVRTLSGEHKKMTEEHKQLVEKKIEIEKLREQLTPQLNYLKLLQGKLASSKLMASSIIADIKFDDLNPEVHAFKRVGRPKYLFFVNFLALLFSLIGVVIRFGLDNRIYDINDLKFHFSELEVLGTTPEFE